MKQDQIRIAPEGAKRAVIGDRDKAEALKTAQLWARLRTRAIHSNEVYWAKCELRKRGYCV
jgi:hypothetical protein